MLLLPLVVLAAPPGTIVKGDYIDVSKQTWIEYEEPITDPLGHPERPWQPKEEFPFKQPYTGVELMYLADSHYGAIGSKYRQNPDNLAIVMNKRGLRLEIRSSTCTANRYDDYKDIYLYDSDKDGKVGTHDTSGRVLYSLDTPANLRGTLGLMRFRLNNPAASWVMDDIWVYSPGLRRVTRLQGGDRQDETTSSPITNDDIGGRQVWEEEHLLIGEDVIYQANLDPQIIAPYHTYATGDFKKDGEWIAKNLQSSLGEEVGMSPYRPDGGVECWVVLSRWAKRTEDPPYGSHVFPDPKMYYLKYRITWIEKVTKTSIWSEQYDHGNRFIKWSQVGPRAVIPGGFLNGGVVSESAISEDLRRLFASWGIKVTTVTGKKAKCPDEWFTPEFLFQEHFWGVRPGPPAPKSIPTPSLWSSKFPKYRKGTQDWLPQEDREFIRNSWKIDGLNEEEADAMMYGDGVIRKEGKVIPVRRHERPALFFGGKPLPVKFPNE